MNDGPPDPLSGTAGSLIASMGSIAVGFGTMLAAPSKALYAVAVKNRRIPDGETSSINSDKSLDFDPQPIRKTVLGNISGGTAMEKTQSDQGGSTITPHVDRSETIHHRLKKDLGSKGLGRILKATVEGAPAKDTC